MNIYSDQRIVLTLDAGGTNFVFSAMQSGKQIGKEITVPSNAHDLELCLQTIIEGFEEVALQVKAKPSAISFAFPGPADYPRGIIGDLMNLPAFRGGVPLGAILESHFDIPVYINNDGDLFAYGEALGGILPEINEKLQENESPRHYRNLAGLTLGTGFGGGIVRDNQLFIGDNSIAAEVWLLSNRTKPSVNAEEIISTRAIQQSYKKYASAPVKGSLMPKDIADIALSGKEGDPEAARKAFADFGRSLGDIVSNLLSLIDGIVVIGGGITNASELYMEAVMKEINSSFDQFNGEQLKRTKQEIYNLDIQSEYDSFLKDHSKELAVPGTRKSVRYDPVPRLGVATSKLGASRSISLGAYAFAIFMMNKV
jgi:glucokinase